MEGSGKPFPGPVEVDETYFGGERRNMSKTKRKAMNKSRGPVGKTAVVGVKDRDSNEVRAEVVHRTDGVTLQGLRPRSCRARISRLHGRSRSLPRDAGIRP